MMDALADGGVYAGVPKDLALKLTAYTMMVRKKKLLSGSSPSPPTIIIVQYHRMII